MKLPLLVSMVVSLCLGCGGDTATSPREDDISPDAVTDLSFSSPKSGRINLQWTAPGDDGAKGRALQYDILF